jgi:GNAT superfamily N-acetyltransferase
MPSIEFIHANIRDHRVELIELNVEYMSWVLEGIEGLFGVPADQVLGMPAGEYVPTTIDKLCGAVPPNGVFYLVNVDGHLAGMGGLRSLSKADAEIKRIFFRPVFRGQKLGEQMLKRLLVDAAAFGYRNAVLDTAPFMKSAHRLYERNGFVDRPAYEGVEVPAKFLTRWRFMQRAL